MSDPKLTIDDLNALPEKMRAHAAAKAVGMTSKEFLAAMAGIGVEIKSAQSGVTRDVLLTWFAGRDDAAAAAETPGDSAPPAEKPARKASAKKSSAKKAPAEKSSTKKAPAEKSSGTKASGQADATPERAPLPEAIVTGDVGIEDTGKRRRRSSASPAYSPLFLSPEDAAAGSGRGTTDSGDAATSTGTDAGAGPKGGGSNDGGSSDSGPGTDADTDTSDDGDQGGNRRRRRGRRGRGRGRGENAEDQKAENGSGSGSDSGDSGSSDEATGDSSGGGRSEDTSSTGSSESRGGAENGAPGDGSDGSGETPSGSRRRRRRRRRGGGGGSGSDDTRGTNDDPPNTEVHEREPRRRSGRGGQGAGTSADQVQGITGSTRLEAKRQRRRDGREAGRRRQPILSESEFLARRESVDRVMVVREKSRDDGRGAMTQVGVLEDKVLVEHFVTTETARSMVGNVFLGRVQNVLPSMEAAFVDIGRGRNGVLYAGEVNWEAAGLGGKARRIEQALKPGDMVLVQVTKDPIGQKGARLSTQVSLAGRFLVYVPDGNSTGISRKLPDTERRRLKAILKDVVPEGSGVIIRTAAEGVSEEEIGRDVARLASQWDEISEAATKRRSSGSGQPTTLYEEPDLLVKVVRDLFNEDFSKLVIQGESSWNTVSDYVSRVAPEMVERLDRYENPDVDVFATHRVDEQLTKALDRKVWLPSGGSLVIDRTEAMTVVDVNTGKYTGSGGNLEETVTKNNLEAAEEIVRQLRLRDIGGMVIVDFIDMVLEGNRDLVLRRLTEALGRDRTRHQVSEVTSLGLVQLTRKKLGTGLVEAFSTPCEHCQGRGLIVHSDPVHTESHNADDSGGRRGRRRGGKSGGSGNDDAAKQTPKKDGPAPTAHPAALAMARSEDSAPEPSSEAPTGGSRTGGEGGTKKAGTSESQDRTTEEATTTSADRAGADDSAGRPEGGGTRSRRRRSSRRPAGEGATTSGATGAAPTESGSAETGPAVVSAEPAAESGSAEAAPAVVSAEPAPAEPATESAPAETTPAESAAGPAPTSAPAASVRGKRRRSTRREAGVAASASSASSAPTPVPPDTGTEVEAATLAEAPTTVAPEPRKRPARRRATRSTVAPTGDGD